MSRAKTRALSYIEETVDSDVMMESSEQVDSVTRQMTTRRPSEQDPFGLIPLGWPEEIIIHTDGSVMYSGSFGSEGLYIVVLINPEHATLLGIHNFYVNSLSDWENLEVSENTDSSEESAGPLSIVAERSHEYLRIITENSGPGFVEGLENNEFWLEKVGSEPILVRMYYTSLP